jgi:hypothetical protein
MRPAADERFAHCRQGGTLLGDRMCDSVSAAEVVTEGQVDDAGGGSERAWSRAT